MRHASAFLLVLLCLAACRPEKKPTAHRVPSKGLPSELLLVVDRAVWESDLADTLKVLTEEPVPGLPQPEPLFRVTRILTPYYKQRFTTMHSQLFVQLDPQQKKPMMGISCDVIATPQIEVTVKAKSLEELRQFLSHHRRDIQDVISDAQLDMRVGRLRKQFSSMVLSEAKKTMGMSIHVPNQIRATKRGKDFLWAGTNLNEKDQNIVLYTYPWEGTEVRTPDYFAWKRDSVMQYNIPGSQPDQWMQTTREQGHPVLTSRIRSLCGRQVQEIHGLWEMRHGAMGGPFVSLVHIDTLHRQVLVAEGFVYSPSTDKRDLLREVEASLRTLHRIN